MLYNRQNWKDLMSNPTKWYRFKELPEDIQNRLKRLPELLSREGALLAYLFGSMARHGSGQDIDLALMMPVGKRPFHLHQTMVDFLDTERIDIVDLRRATPVLRFEIMSTGHCIFAADDTIQADSELAWLREYKDTAWLRRRQEILLKERLKQWSLDAKASPND
jgi:predicted nucleotidyltransferase